MCALCTFDDGNGVYMVRTSEHVFNRQLVYRTFISTFFVPSVENDSANIP